MKTHFLKTTLWSSLLMASSFLFSSSGTPGYDESGNDIDECQEAPCPYEYTCINIQGSFFCISPEGEVIEGGSSSKEGYDIKTHDCEFEGSIDPNGYITLFGIRKFVGVSGGATYYKRYKDVRVDCRLNGNFLCQSYTCAQFWTNMK